MKNRKGVYCIRSHLRGFLVKKTEGCERGIGKGIRKTPGACPVLCFDLNGDYMGMFTWQKFT